MRILILKNIYKKRLVVIKFIEKYFMHSDDRGLIKGIVNFGQWEEVNFISSDANVQRGNHFHQETTELFFILDGKIKVIVQKVDKGNLVGEQKEYIVAKGDIFLMEKNVNHIFYVLEKSQWINMLSKKIDPHCPDIVRI